jgi:hypothetical protein
MTKSEFMALCGKHLIDVNVALEIPEVVQALRDRKPIADVEAILQSHI